MGGCPAVVCGIMVESPLADLGDVVERFDHVSVAVNSIRASLPLVNLLEGRFHDGGDQSSDGFRWVQFCLPGAGKLELIEPLQSADEDNFLVRFLGTNGEGIHHLTLKVADIEEAITRAAALGLDVVGIDLSNDGWKEAFVHPKSANGVLVQLAEWTDRPAPDLQLEDVLDKGTE